jgi:vancomycin permeability regulator SanA
MLVSLQRARVASRLCALDQAPRRLWALVLGAPPPQPTPQRPTGTLLLHRLQASAALWHAGQAGQLFVTGTPAEVVFMRQALRDGGVPEAALTLDPAATTTWTNLAHARDHGITEALVVTNGFHLPRAVGLALALGIDAVGVDAGPAHPVSARVRLGEELSTARALLRGRLRLG